MLKKLQKLFHEHTLEISAIGVVVSAVLFFISILMFLPDYAPAAITDMSRQIGDWEYWLVIISPIILVTSGFYLGDNILKRREFNKLINTTSKASFVRNLDDIEYLAWKLTEKHAAMVDEKKREFNIRDKAK